MSTLRTGSAYNGFLKQESVFQDAQAMQAGAIKEAVAWQLAEAMKAQSLTKSRMATMLKTSRSQVDRLLDPGSDITLSSLQRAATLVGRRIQIELV
ncbi:XRE family transcriptional regulator [Nitrosovibrio sp. Nv17]|uniref:XRE family transcriptional regulator n=1 Tax=Nitrosovibrio sp. Nv17 TaxID=1855339 RepID=UPI000908E366|nr:XRE family transcriptional regulator [Nitrosovibrio sp. Nv17]SFW21659.1 Helix-turn-helix domain-containing protein [Nitrosovibrio sp. Nv17]